MYNDQITDVIFDLDGTLIDSAPSILLCFSAALLAQNIEPVLPLTNKLIGPPLLETLSRLSGVEDDESLSTMVEAFKQHYDTTGYKSTSAFHGVDKMLKELNMAGYRLHIATNKRLRPTCLILEHLGWSCYFKTIYATDSRSPSFSSKSEMLSVLINVEDICSDQAVYVGDRADDMRSAYENELNFIAAAWGYHDEEMVLTTSEVTSIQEPAQVGEYLLKDKKI